MWWQRSSSKKCIGSPETGEDLLQEIFLQAYRKVGGFKGDAAIGTWLYRLALNHCLDFVRSRQAKMDKATDAAGLVVLQPADREALRANGLFLAVRTMETPTKVEHAPLRVGVPLP